MNPTVYTQSDTTHRAEAPTFYIEYRGTTVAYPGFLNGGGERTEESGNFLYLLL